MHLHCHIAECLRDYGPAHATWCFSFECYNGILGRIPNNNQSLDVERTMIKHFVQQIDDQCIPPQFASDFASFFPATEIGSVNETMCTRPISLLDILNLSRSILLSELT